MTIRQQKGADQYCRFHPCHKDGLEDCTFCYCPFYPCEDDDKGKWLQITKYRKIWDCSKCTWIHSHKVVKYIYDKIQGVKNDLFKKS